MRGNKRHSTLCFWCANATTSGCSWSKSLIPVNGWDAESSSILLSWVQTKDKNPKYYEYKMKSFDVYDCPEFIEHEMCKKDVRWAKELIKSRRIKGDHNG